MPRALGLVAALALAACQVDLDGAICREPGATADCPAGQACGNDGRCSERALSCAASRCTPGATRCADAAALEECSATDAACGAWVRVSCAERQLVCGARPDRPAACECPANAAAELAAGAGGSLVVGDPPYPNGLATPAECRFGRLGDALAAARSSAQAGVPSVVAVHGAAGADVVFGAATGESFPLEIPSGVTLVGASAPAGATIVRAEGAAGATVMTVQGAVERVRIEAAGASGVGIATSCLDAATRPSLSGVEVIGGGTLATGIEVAGGDCGAALTGVDVSGAVGPALSVASSLAGPVTVERSRFRESGTGIRMTAGKLTVGSDDPTSGMEVSGNLGDGIVVEGGSARIVDVALLRTLIEANGGTGVVLDLVGESSMLTVRGCTVYANGATSARTYGPGSSQRPAGGVFITQGSLAFFSFAGNRLSANAGDQLAFDTGTASTWSISPRECGAASNLFACVGSGYAVSCAAGTVDANFSVWPEGGYNRENFVSAGVTSTVHCNGAKGAPAPPATCPSP